MAADVSDLLLLLNDVGRLIRVEADRRARVHGLTRAQWQILVRIEASPGLSQRELAALLEVEPITVARLVDRLEAGDFLERRPDPADRRIWRLHPRPAAAEVLVLLGHQKAAILTMLTHGVADAELDTARAVLARMRDNVATCVRREALEIA